MDESDKMSGIGSVPDGWVNPGAQHTHNKLNICLQ